MAFISYAWLAIVVWGSHAAHFPVHQWDTVPAFFHSSVLDSVTWCDEDLQTIIKFPIVTIEKWMGCNSTPGCYVPGHFSHSVDCPTQQGATLAAAAQLKAARPDMAIATWFDSLRIYSQRTMNPDILDIEWQSCVRNAHTPFLESHPSYLLHNTSGQPALESYLHAHVYDHTQQAVRDFWRDACLNMTNAPGALIDGCGADASQQPGSYIHGLSPSVSSAWTTGHTQAIAEATAAVSAQGGFILGKLVQQLGVDTNGILQEACDASNSTINVLLQAAAAATRDGKRYLYECHADQPTMSALAAFLIGAAQDHYWGFGTWVSQTCGSASGSWIPELALPLGAPLAQGAYDPDTSTWTRSFAKGTNVTFNAATNVGSISWGQA